MCLSGMRELLPPTFSAQIVSLDTCCTQEPRSQIACRMPHAHALWHAPCARKVIFYVSAFIGMHHGMRRGFVPRFLRTADFGGS